MARPEWLRTFLAVYRSRSITDAARLRCLSQPAASQQLAALERATGTPLFVRRPAGVVPTERGRALYVEIAGALDQLESVLTGLDAGRVVEDQPPVRLGASAELFAATIVARLARLEVDVVARFGADAELIDGLERGELDVIVTSRAPARRSIATVPLGEKRFLLVGPPRCAPQRRFASLASLGPWLAGQPWVAYSQELPITRRFWQAHLGRPFPSGNLRLVAPDLRAVAAAVAAGLGCSLLPAFVCADGLARGRMVEIHPVSMAIPPEPWLLCYRDGEAARQGLARVISAVTDLDG